MRAGIALDETRSIEQQPSRSTRGMYIYENPIPLRIIKTTHEVYGALCSPHTLSGFSPKTRSFVQCSIGRLMVGYIYIQNM